MIEPHISENELSTDRLHIALIGAQKNGKSILSSTAPGNKLILDFDQRIEALAGKKGVYGLKFVDPQFPQMPTVAEEVLDVVTGLEKSLDLSQLKDKKQQPIFPNLKPETIVDCVVLDSMQMFAKAVQQNELYNNKDIRREISLGPAMKHYVPKGYDAWNAEVGGVTNVIMRLFALPINVICVFHEAAEEANDSTNENPRFTGRVTIYPVRYRNILSYFNEVWRVKLQQVTENNKLVYLPRVFPKPDFAMDSATTMLLDSVEEPNIEAMILKHKVRSGAIKTLPLTASATK